jgi:hypothetical protein
MLAPSDFGTIEPRLLRGSFGDPRMPAPGDAWGEVARHEPDSFRAFMESLIREDLAFFFRVAMNEPDRERFWLRYVKRIERTICVMDWQRHEQLKSELSTAPPEVRAAFARAYTSRSGSLSGFCLFLRGDAGEAVAVEFSDNGHAAYVYDRRFFDEALLPIVGQLNQTKQLKVQGRERFRITHGSSWEDTAESRIAGLGISLR